MRISLRLLFMSLMATGALAAESVPKSETLQTALARGLEREFNCVEIPVGTTKVSADLKSKLKGLEPQGLATVREAGEDAAEGSVVVSPTKLAMDNRDPAQSSRKLVVLRMGTVEVTKIVKNVSYTGHKLPQSGNYRFVLGTYRVVPTPLAKQIDTKCDTKEHKFRAIVEENPFTGRFGVKRADWGEPDEEGWQSSTVE